MTLNSFRQIIPIFLGVILLISLAINVFSQKYFLLVFTGNIFIDPVIGAVLGSIAAGNPINSYIIGGELFRNGVSLVSVAAFIISWVTVGVVQLPAESLMLGKRFALYRNAISLVMAILMSIALVTILGMI